MKLVIGIVSSILGLAPSPFIAMLVVDQPTFRLVQTSLLVLGDPSIVVLVLKSEEGKFLLQNSSLVLSDLSVGVPVTKILPKSEKGAFLP